MEHDDAGRVTPLRAVDEALLAGRLDEAEQGALAGHEPGRAPAPAWRLRLAWCDLARDRVDRAWRTAEEVAEASADADALETEIQARALAAWAATRLGLHVEAVDQAAQAVRLAEQLPAQDASWRHVALAALSLGSALGWAGDEPGSREGFAVASQWCRRFGAGLAARQVAAERRWVLRLRRAFGHPAEGLEGDAIDAPAPFEADPLPLGLVPRPWLEESDRASRGQAMDPPAEGSPSWWPAATAWARAEHALACGDAEAASVHARQLVDLAEAAVHVPLQGVGRRLAAEALARQGEHARARDELATLLEHEHRLAAVQRERCARRAVMQVDLRSARRAVQSDSDRFRRWAFEDALTGIANLRQFNASLGRWSQTGDGAQAPLCVALIDVDRFKQINDRHGHPVGDVVLRGIAETLKAQVREGDLAARWGGDEFAVLFRGADLATAEQVAGRIADAVEQHDWSAMAPGLEVSVSVGVVQARAGDSKQDLVSRSDDAMYACKRRRHRRQIEKTVPPAQLRQVLAWLRKSNRVVFLLGHAADQGRVDGSLRDMHPRTRDAFVRARGPAADPSGFAAYWRDWRRAMEGLRPGEGQWAAVALARLLPEPAFVTECIDGTAALAGAHGVIELYGNGLRTRCSACGHRGPVVRGGHCMACGAGPAALRPDIVLLDEAPDPALLATAELTFKLAELVLLVDADLDAWNTVSLLHKAQARGARIVSIGLKPPMLRDLPHLAIRCESAPLLRLLAEDLQSGTPDLPVSTGLSEAGDAACAYLGGHGVDDLGRTLADSVAWMLSRQRLPVPAMPWMFPLPSRSRANPDAPMPTRADFAVMARDEAVRAGLQRSFEAVLEVFGLAWDAEAGRVGRQAEWRAGYAKWAPSAGPNDLFISRVLGALTLCGKRREAAALLALLEEEAPRWRGEDAHRPLAFWRLALRADGAAGDVGLSPARGAAHDR